MNTAVRTAVERVDRAVCGAVGDGVDAAVRELLRSAVRGISEAGGPQGSGVGWLAARCGTTRRTLFRSLHPLGMTPGRVLAWGRLLVAAELLTGEGSSIEEAAMALGLSDAAALGHLCRRHLGMPAGALRHLGGSAPMLRLLLQHITRGGQETGRRRNG